MFERITSFAVLLLFSFSSQQLAAQDEIKGYADLHIHMMTEYAFGGAWLYGSIEGEEKDALKACTGNLSLSKHHRDHARTVVPVLNEFIGKIQGTEGDTGLHAGKRGGFPNYEGWPRWDTIAHQQVWNGHLKYAFEHGLKLIVLSTMNFKPLCDVMPRENKKYDCNDMNAIRRELRAARAFVNRHPWAEIVTSPEQARTTIANGKLAIVLAIETSDLFAHGDWRAQLNEMISLGVRSIQPVHLIDNKFAGTAPNRGIFDLFEILRNIKNQTYIWPHLGFDLDEHKNNKKGLTFEGKELVREMMKQKIIVDLAHLSERGVKDFWKMDEELYTGKYPLFISHGHIRAMLTPEFAGSEKTSPDWILALIKKTKGMFGLRTGPEPMKTFGSVPNDCDGSSKSFAQAYEYGTKKLGLAMSFATDFNGFIQQLRPRFGGDRETCGAAASKKTRQKQQLAQRIPVGNSFDRNGLGHIGLLPSLVSELENFDVDVSPLYSSVEQFLQMWTLIESLEPIPSAPTEPNRGLATEE